MNAHLSRRLFLGGLTSAALAPFAASRASAIEGISVGCWGSAYAEALDAVVDAPLLKNAQIRVRQIVSDERARVARVVAASAQTHLDVAMLSDTDAYRLSLTQIFVPVTTDGVGMLPHVPSKLRLPYGVSQGQTALCIAYNPSKLSDSPRGFAALFEAAGKGRAGFSSELAIHNLAAAAIAQRRAPASLEAAKATFIALKKAGSLRVYATNDALGEALASGEISMAPMWRSRVYVWQQDGRDVRDSFPAEGAVPFTIVACVPNAGDHAQAALRYLDALLHPDAQVGMAQRVGLLPTIDAAPLDAKLLDRIGFTAGQRSRFRPLSLSAVAHNGVALRQFWDHELA